MTWVLYFLWFNGSYGLFYGGNYLSHSQCDAMAQRINMIEKMSTEHRDPALPYICVQVPEEK